MLTTLKQRRLALLTGLEFCQREQRWRLRTAKSVAEVMDGDGHKKIDYHEVLRPLRGYSNELKTRLKLYDIIDGLEFQDDPEQLVPYLYCLATEQVKLRRESSERKAIQAAILAGEAAAAASVLSNYVEVPYVPA